MVSPETGYQASQARHRSALVGLRVSRFQPGGEGDSSRNELVALVSLTPSVNTTSKHLFHMMLP